MPALNNLTGKVFGRLTVLARTDNSKRGDARWTCVCSCGTTVEVLGNSLSRGVTESCGCLIREANARRNFRHGLRNHPLYGVWTAMKARCTNKKDKRYKDYGGRGITVCQEWTDSFQDFYQWSIANGYARGLQLDRRENDSNYTPGNCHFVTAQVNNENKRPYKNRRST